MIKLIDVNYEINNFKILNNINLEIKTGTKLGIVGLSGAGKSSLIRTINGLIKPTSGEVLVNNKSINKLKNSEINEIRKNVGMIFQHFNLLDQKNVFENIALPLRLNNLSNEKVEKRVLELVEIVGLKDKLNNYPKTLSGGEKQRVAIARAIANNPKYLLADEATSALDKKTSKDILDLLHEINKKYNVTIIFVSHDLDAVKYLCNEVCLIDKGEIIEKNNTLNMFINPKKDITKKLINEEVYKIAKDSKDLVYQITYDNNIKDKALISNLIKKYDVSINILSGRVIEINKTKVGFLYINIKGKDKTKVLNKLKEEVEVVKYV